MRKLTALVITLFMLFSPYVSATNYYVSSTTGNNSSNGKSVSSAWKTISKINEMKFLPGDSILFKKGDIWRETLIMPSSGAAGKPIVFAAYGNGNNPKIYGSKRAITWVHQGANIWKSATSVNNPYAGNSGEVWFQKDDGTVIWGIHKSNTEGLKSEYNWSWNVNHIYIYSPSDPNISYVSVEVPQSNFCISLNDKEYLTIDGLEIKFAKYSGVDFQGTYPNLARKGFTIKNCSISYFGKRNGDTGYGINVAYSNMLIQGNTIHDCGRRGISIYCYGAITVENVIVENNTCYNGYHTTGIDISCGSYNLTHFDNFIIRNNLIFDTPATLAFSHLIFLQCYKNKPSTFTNIYIYNNIFKYPPASGIQMEGVTGVHIYNNTFYGHNTERKGNTFHVYVSTGSTGVIIKNNIFYTDLDFHTNSSGVGIYVMVPISNITCDYNIYYRKADNLRLTEVNGTSYYRNNSSWNEYRKVTGWETHGQAIDPKFVSSTDYHLQKGSPAIGAGIAIPKIITDFEGKYFKNPPSIGALEVD